MFFDFLLAWHFLGVISYCWLLIVCKCIVVSTFLSLCSLYLLLTLVAAVGVTAVGVTVLPDCKEIQHMSGKALSLIFLSSLLSCLSPTVLWHWDSYCLKYSFRVAVATKIKSKDIKGHFLCIRKEVNVLFVMESTDIKVYLFSHNGS